MKKHSTASETFEPSISATSKRGCLFLVRRGLLVLVILIITLSLLGFVYEAAAEASDRQSYRPPGQMVDVGGYRLHIHCTGEGSPTVILEAGAAALWAWVQPAVAQSTRVCAYDRAGYGWSEPGPEPRDAQHIATELHALLDAAAIQPPYVISAHSIGGIYTRAYYRQYPDEVAGMVLVDATHPDNWERQGESIDTLQAMAGVSAVLSRVGVMRLVAAGQRFDLPETSSAALLASMSSSQYWSAQRADAAAIPASLEQARISGDLGDLPLAVLVALTYPEGRGRDTERALQLELAALSTNSLYREIPEAGHITLLTDEQYAQQVSDTILHVIEAAQTGESLAQ
jgi:pimeloyl-ACP methyl ester carboxylesterase